MTAVHAPLTDTMPTRSTVTTASTVTQQVRVTSETNVSPSTILIDEAVAPVWLRSVFLKMVRWAREADPTDVPQFERCIAFLSSLRYFTPEPFVAMGDNGSIGVEWDRRGSHLHMTFSAEEDEVYWLGQDGTEKEELLSTIGGDLNDLIRMISSY